MREAAPRARDPERDRLVGRALELASIARLLDGIQPGRPTVLQISGESGIGKTRLLSRLVADATRRDCVTFTGQAGEFQSDEPFGVVLDAFNHALASLPNAALATLGRDSLSELANVFSAVASRLRRGSPERRVPFGAGADRYRLHRAFVALLDVLAAGKPLLLAIDDLHWADHASVELLLYLLSRPPQTPLFVAVAHRAPQLAPKTAAALHRAQRDSTGQLIKLAPLSARDARALLPSGLSNRVAERIYSDSGGNPLYLRELARAARSGQPPRSGRLRGERNPVPQTVGAVIAEELRRLSPDAHRLIQGAAVVGDPFEAELAGEVIDLDQAQTLDALDELLDRELVQHASQPLRFRFRHPVVRHAVYESATNGSRRGLHAQAARVLADRNAPPSVRARHIECSARQGDMDAVEQLASAGHEAAPRAPAAAAVWFRGALGLLPGQDTSRRAELSLAMAISLAAAGDLNESRDAFCEVQALLPGALTISAMVPAALVEHLLGNHDTAQNMLLGALTACDPDSPEAAQLKLEISHGCFLSADWNGQRYWAQKALDAEHAAPLARMGATAALALAHYGLIDTRAAREWTDRSVALAESVPDQQWGAQLQSLAMLGWAQYCVGRFADAERHMRRALTVAQDSGTEHLSPALLVVQAMSNLALGRLDAAARQADTAVDAARVSANRLFLTWGMTTRCMVELERGAPDAALRLGAQAAETAEAAPATVSAWASVAPLYLAEAHLDHGSPQQFRDVLFAGQGAPRLPPLPFYAVHGHTLLTQAELKLGHPEAAARWVAQADRLASTLGLPAQEAQALRCQALLAINNDRQPQAAELAQASAERAESAHQPLQAAKARMLAAAALTGHGDRSSASLETRNAADTFKAHGALSRYRQAARQLEKLGAATTDPKRPADSATRGLDRLSRRELMIAERVHHGQTNRQIAEELEIGMKTVENHMTKIFRRLEISSRTQLASLMATHPATTP